MLTQTAVAWRESLLVQCATLVEVNQGINFKSDLLAGLFKPLNFCTQLGKLNLSRLSVGEKFIGGEDKPNQFSFPDFFKVTHGHLGTARLTHILGRV